MRTYGGAPSYSYSFERDLIYPAKATTPLTPAPAPDEVIGAPGVYPAPEITLPEMGNQHLLEQLDPLKAAIKSGDFVRSLDRVENIEQKVFILQQIPANFQRPQGTATKSIKPPKGTFGWKGISGTVLAGAGARFMFVPVPGARLLGVALMVSGAGLVLWDYIESPNQAFDYGEAFVNEKVLDGPMYGGNEQWSEIEKDLKLHFK